MTLQRCYNESEDQFPLPPHIKDQYGPFGLPEARDPTRPYISSNFVMGLDGRASFRELTGQAGGREVSRSKEDRWLMDFIRAHHDAQIMGASTLREELGRDSKGWDYAVNDAELGEYREKTLRLGRTRVIIVTGSGEVDLSFRVFNSPRVEPWVITAAAGAKNLQARLKALSRGPDIKIVSVGEGSIVDISAAMRALRQEHGIRTLLCEGGPTLYAEMLNRQVIDEEFRTLSLQVLGKTTKPPIERPTPYGHLSYVPDTAPWFRLISLHYALPYHSFLRVRYEGPRKFET
ncbi:MAG TPA: dihydrofolate reductase family protein [Terriglobales bacterium]|nr:dihydrofolate reductase family protein [Terriglobales bacterium]